MERTYPDCDRCGMPATTTTIPEDIGGDSVVMGSRGRNVVIRDDYGVVGAQCQECGAVWKTS